MIKKVGRKRGRKMRMIDLIWQKQNDKENERIELCL